MVEVLRLLKEGDFTCPKWSYLEGCRGVFRLQSLEKGPSKAGPVVKKGPNKAGLAVKMRYLLGLHICVLILHVR